MVHQPFEADNLQSQATPTDGECDPYAGARMQAYRSGAGDVVPPPMTEVSVTTPDSVVTVRVGDRVDCSVPPRTERHLPPVSLEHDRCGHPDDEPPRVGVRGPYGGEIFYGADGRIQSLRPEKSKFTFKFGYDESSGILNHVTNEQGVWNRKPYGNGMRYTDTWIRESDGEEWTGEVAVNERAYGYRNASRQMISFANGARMRTANVDGGTYYLSMRDPDGNSLVADYRTGITTKKLVDGSSTVWNRRDRSKLEFDARGQLTYLCDGTGREARFSQFDNHGKPRLMFEGKQQWQRSGDSTWYNPDSGRYRYGDVDLKREDAGRASYTFKDWSGKRTTWSSDGITSTTYGGVTTRVDRNNESSVEFADGSRMKDGSYSLTPRFKVDHKKGRTIDVTLAGANISVVKSKNDVHADMRLAENQPVSAFQDGLVVYSSRDPDSDDQRAHSVIGLSPDAKKLIEQYKALSPGDDDIVVVQVYDKKCNGVRYELYSGFRECNVVTGDRVEGRKTILGRVGRNQTLHYGVRRNAVHGQAIDVTVH